MSNNKEEDLISSKPVDDKAGNQPDWKKRPSIDELISRITPENLHPETDWGTPVGKEIWWER